MAYVSIDSHHLPLPNAAVPQLGSIANVTTAAVGLSTAQRRNVTTRLQISPNRTGAFVTGGSAAIDPEAAAVLAGASSASVSKDVACEYNK